MTTQSDRPTPDAAPSADALSTLLPRELERLANAWLASSFAGAPEAAVPGPAALARTSDPASALGAGARLVEPALPTSLTPLVPAQPPLAPLPPPRIGPSALAVGAGGASPAVSAPPLPGILQQPPPASAPWPRESDLRGLSAVYAENVHGTSAVPLFAALESGATLAPGTPYFVDIAGLPDGLTAVPTSDIPTSIPLVEPSLGEVPSAPSADPLAEVALVPRGLSVGLTDPGEPAYAPSLTAAPSPTPRLFDPYAIKRDFPILQERVHGKPLVWLDNGATTQKPQSVIDRLSYFYAHENSNVHRAAHTLAARSTDAYEAAREKVQRFLHARSASEVVFTRGTTEAINLVAQSWGRANIGPGDEIVITWLEHHANIVPWQQLAREKGAVVRVVPVDESGQVELDAYERLLGPRTRLVAMSQVSNALGTIVPVREMVQLAHRYGATTLVDGAQAVSHMRVDVQRIDSDFYVFSGHKLFAPTGIGALVAKRALLDAMPPWQGGGNMIQDVTFEKTEFAAPPARFEAGTGNIADAIGLGAAIDYIESIGIDNVSHYEHQLLHYGTERLLAIPGLRMIGTARDKAGVMSFVLDGVPVEQIGAALDRDGIAVRSGHHCAQPILRRFGVEATVRATLAPYNTCDDLDQLVESLTRVAREERTRR